MMKKMHMFLSLGIILLGLTFQAQASFQEKIDGLNREKEALLAQFAPNVPADLNTHFRECLVEQKKYQDELDILEGKNEDFNAYQVLGKQQKNKHLQKKFFGPLNKIFNDQPKKIAKIQELQKSLVKIGEQIQGLIRLTAIEKQIKELQEEQAATIAEALKIVEKKKEQEDKKREEEKEKHENAAQIKKKVDEKREAKKEKKETKKAQEVQQRVEAAAEEKRRKEAAKLKQEEQRQAKERADFEEAARKQREEEEKNKAQNQGKPEVGFCDAMMQYVQEHPILVGSATASVVLPTSVFGYFVVNKHAKLVEKQKKAAKAKEPFKYEDQNLWLVASKKVLGNMSEAVKRQGRKIRSLVKSNDKKVKTSEVA